MNDELEDHRDRLLFLEHYLWGQLLSCWRHDGTFCHYSFIRGAKV